MRVLMRGRVRWAALIAVVGALAVGGIAYATIPDANGVIHGCYKRSGGALRVIDHTVINCAANETSLNWNVAGQQGPPGPPGPPGEPGATGPPGISGLETVEVSGPAQSPVFTVESAECPSGKKLIGGGGRLTPLAGVFYDDIALGSSYPLTDTEWQVVASEVHAVDGNWILTVYAICANVS